MFDSNPRLTTDSLREAFMDSRKRLPTRHQFCDNCEVWQPVEGSRQGSCSEHGREFNPGDWCGEWR